MAMPPSAAEAASMYCVTRSEGGSEFQVARREGVSISDDVNKREKRVGARTFFRSRSRNSKTRQSIASE